MRHAAATISLLASLCMLGCSSTADVPTDDASALEEAMPTLGSRDFARGLGKSFIAGTHTIDSARFEAKWRASIAGPALTFYRAYPGAFHADFARNLREDAAKTKLAHRAIGLCVGDAHPDNFGFLKLGRRVVYAYNDLDDAGNCPVALDVLRYVTAVRVFFDDADLAARAARRYVEVVTGERSETRAREDIAKIREDAPDFAERKSDKLDELARGDALVRGEGLSEVAAQTRAAIERAVSSVMPGTVLDVVFVQRDAGGSGGLDRYWLLFQRGSTRTVMELKESTTPGVDLGIGASPISPDRRLSLLKREIWGVDVQDDYVYARALGKTFLLRDRLAKASIDSLELKRGAREDLVDAQASFLGLLHKPAYQGHTPEARAYRRWLEESSATVADRWKSAFGAR